MPTPLLLLAITATAIQLPGVGQPDPVAIQQAVNLALVVILFDGGLQIGMARIRPVAREVLLLGLLGTLATTAGVAVIAHQLLGTSWYVAVLVGAALAPTDPAVVFAVLGRRGTTGRSGTILQGESGANDPIGIALMAALLGAGALSWSAAGHVVASFAEQLGVGVAAGAAGGWLLRQAMRRLSATRSLMPLAMLAAVDLYGLTTLSQGSGFLAVFVAGILVADTAPPYLVAAERLHIRLASGAEAAAFLLLGLTVDLGAVADAWLPGLAVSGLLLLVVRPVVGYPLLWRSELPAKDRRFVLLAGLKGAVPLLLGTMLLTVPDGQRLYGVVVVVVAASVLVQGTVVAKAAERS